MKVIGVLVLLQYNDDSSINKAYRYNKNKIPTSSTLLGMMILIQVNDSINFHLYMYTASTQDIIYIFMLEFLFNKFYLLSINAKMNEQSTTTRQCTLKKTTRSSHFPNFF